MRKFYTNALAACLFCLGLFSSLHAQTAADVVVPITVTTTSSPASITLSFPAVANATVTLIGRKQLFETSWSFIVLPPTATSFTDNSVVAGVGFEYLVLKQTSVAPTTRFGMVYAGIQVLATAYRGKVILVVDNALTAPLAAELNRFMQDLRGDGWQVVRHDIDVSTAKVPGVKDLLRADYTADPTNTVAAFLIGNIPVPYSGEINPDGHDDHIGAWPTDYYYGDMDEDAWSDEAVNNTSASRPANQNVPGDGKFDQSLTPTLAEIVVSRLDFSNLSGWNVSQTELYRRYLNKNHAFRTGAYRPDNKTIVDDNFGFASGEAFALDGWQNGNALTGTNSVVAGDFFSNTKNQSFLLGYGCGPGTYIGAGGVGTSDNFKTDSVNVTFSMLFGSYFGDWDYEVNPFMPSALASKGGILTCAWSGRPHWQFHQMGLGEPILTSTYWMWLNSFLSSPVYPTTGDYDASVHVGMLGDPTLRLHSVQPPQNVVATASCTGVNLSWTVSADAGLGYLVYRAPSLDSIFKIITPNLITGTSYTDTMPFAGQNYYQVKLFKLQTVPTGSYYNQSIGTPASVVFSGGMPLSVSAAVMDVSCHGGSDGSISVTVTGGSGMPPTYQWASGEEGPFLDQVTAGIYTVTVTDPQGCTVTASATVKEPAALMVDLFAANIYCFGQQNGSIDASVIGGTPPYQYLWSNGAMGPTVTGLSPGTTTVTITDANGCTTTASTAITEPAELATSLMAASPSCHGGSNGYIDLSVSGGTPPYAYMWSNNNTTQDLGNLPAGTYSVTITDNNGCATTTSATLSEPSAITAETVVMNAGCAGATNGGISLMVNGGTPDYTYLWSDGSTDENLSNVPAGTYTVTITDIAGCTLTLTRTVQQITTLTLTAEASAASCFGSADGSAMAMADGGAPGYNYVWSTGEMAQAISDLMAGTYTVTVTDDAGCSQTATATVGQPTMLNGQAAWHRSDCTNTTGDVTLAAGGGTPGYSYNWSTGAATQNLTGVPPAVYTVTVTDAAGCTAVLTNTVVQIPPLQATADVSAVTCFGGSDGALNLSVSGGDGPNYTYLWSDGATTQDLQGLMAGPYTVTVTDGSGCSLVQIFDVEQPTEVVAIVSSIAEITCFGGTDGGLEVLVSGGTPGYTYLWSTGAMTDMLGNLSSGIYSLTATDANGCTGELLNLALTDPPPVQGALFPFENTVCAGNETALMIDTILGGAGGPYLYSINNGSPLSPDFPYLAGAGTYTVTYFDQAGCSTSEMVQIGEYPPSGASIAGQDTACVDMPVMYSLPGNFSDYNWLASNNGTVAQGQGTNSISVLWATPDENMLTVYFTNSDGCPDSAALSVYVYVCVGTHQPVLAGVQVQPNPFGTWLSVRFSRPIKPGARLRLLDVNGRLIVEQTPLGSPMQIETAALPTGTYFLQIVENNSVGVWKLVKME